VIFVTPCCTTVCAGELLNVTPDVVLETVKMPLSVTAAVEVPPGLTISLGTVGGGGGGGGTAGSPGMPGGQSELHVHAHLFRHSQSFELGIDVKKNTSRLLVGFFLIIDFFFGLNK
jgi:hypothetical protein